ncbi:hypothetical protein SLEP1_g43241 [Rubroshorea leprosula]|uniref:Uncharacterized protein n=1 Tax=Rubroshorea leprosula TaxID=152421 RepID=A0AAV5LCU2_9ROSI|nr:hypothetical protein SLEP1_g43241 [Rubroshorea leprosula]
MNIWIYGESTLAVTLAATSTSLTLGSAYSASTS